MDCIYRAGLVAQWVDASCPWLAVSEDSVLLPSIAWIISLQHILQALPSLFVPCFFFAHSTGPAFLTPRPPPAAKKKSELGLGQPAPPGKTPHAQRPTKAQHTPTAITAS